MPSLLCSTLLEFCELCQRSDPVEEGGGLQVSCASRPEVSEEHPLLASCDGHVLQSPLFIEKHHPSFLDDLHLHSILSPRLTLQGRQRCEIQTKHKGR